jgi:hypothetical protein
VHTPQQRRRRDDGDGRGAVAEDREELAERGLDQDEAGDVGQAAADPVADRRGEAQIVAEARLGVGVDAGISMPTPAMVQAIRAPSPPVARPNAEGTAKMPEPTIEPTTRATSARRESFCSVDEVMPASYWSSLAV